MGKISKEEWVKGTSTLKISTPAQLSLAVTELNNLLIRDMSPLKKISNDKYDRTQYVGYAKDTKAAFNKLYLFCFALVKPEQSKNIDMETSTALWSVLLVPKYPMMSEVLEFIAEKEGSYRATNKDLWSMMLEFCQTIKPDLQDYETDGAWPTLLDDFVAWKKAKMTNTPNADQMQG
ncbi:DUF298-domain-containing protein [Cyathus striatus]|nr:DUF298-domain-containing protein [Cyathus striatus]